MQTQKKLEVSSLSSVNYNTDIKIVSAEMDKLPLHSIDIVNWKNFAYQPNVSFSLAHCGDCILLKFFVEEKHYRATYKNSNDPVYKDSCVEFFISFPGKKEYYNLEFNSLGACLMQYGANKQERQFVSETLIERIKRHCTIRNANQGEKTTFWELTLVIPIDVFCFTELSSFQGAKAKANFYKCGDDLPVPHYLSWNKIVVTKPDFHRPDFFGEIKFV